MTTTATDTILVTGGAGFIGSAVIRELMRTTDATVINVDKLTYAASLDSVASVSDDPRYRFAQVDICDRPAIGALLQRDRPRAIVHLAAETHVDRSIDSPGVFVETNIVGTFALLDAALAYWRTLDSDSRHRFRLLHISTDEVFGSLGEAGAFTEETPYRPSSPYSASKAAADHLARAWHITYGLPLIVTNCSNNFGPFQFPEKLIPLLIEKGLAGERLPIYGSGRNVRDWLYVEDHAAALHRVLRDGRPGNTYNIGARNERTNIEVAREICAVLDRLLPGSPHRPHANLITFVKDRPGHDFRYAIDPSKIEQELGWAPTESFASAIEKTVAWYLQNREWCQRAKSRGYDGARLGLGGVPSSAAAPDRSPVAER